VTRKYWKTIRSVAHTVNASVRKRGGTKFIEFFHRNLSKEINQQTEKKFPQRKTKECEIFHVENMCRSEKDGSIRLLAQELSVMACYVAE